MYGKPKVREREKSGIAGREGEGVREEKKKKKKNRLSEFLCLALGSQDDRNDGHTDRQTDTNR